MYMYNIVPCVPEEDANACCKCDANRGCRAGPALTSTLAHMYRWAYMKNEKLHRKQPLYTTQGIL